MAEASLSLSQAQLRTKLHFAAYTRARQVATNTVKRQLQAQGLRPMALTRRELRTLAEAYLAENREELIAEAKAEVARWAAEGFFGKRAQVSSPAQRGKA